MKKMLIGLLVTTASMSSAFSSERSDLALAKAESKFVEVITSMVQIFGSGTVQKPECSVKTVNIESYIVNCGMMVYRYPGMPEGHGYEATFNVRVYQASSKLEAGVDLDTLKYWEN